MYELAACAERLTIRPQPEHKILPEYGLLAARLGWRELRVALLGREGAPLLRVALLGRQGAPLPGGRCMPTKALHSLHIRIDGTMVGAVGVIARDGARVAVGQRVQLIAATHRTRVARHFRKEADLRTMRPPARTHRVIGWVVQRHAKKARGTHIRLSAIIGTP